MSTALKVAFRTEGDLVNVYIATLDGKQRTWIASMLLVVANIDPALGQQWNDVVAAIGTRCMEVATGLTVSESYTCDPADLESEPNA